MDEDGNKNLNLQELSDGLKEYGLELSADEISAMFQQLDSDGSGNVNFDEFIVAVRVSIVEKKIKHFQWFITNEQNAAFFIVQPPMNDSRKKLIELAFQKLDKTGDGEVSIDDLKGVYNVKYHPRYISGEESEESIMNKFLANFEKHSSTDGVVSRKFPNQIS